MAVINRIQCTRCFQTKSPGEFSSNEQKNNGKSSWCKQCTSEKSSDAKTIKITKTRLGYHGENFRERRDFIPDGDLTMRTGMSIPHSSVSAPLKKVELTAPISCPCCKQPVGVPTIDIVVDHYGVTPLQAKILGAVWRGRGLPVMTERIFDAMYVDDPDGGPSPTRMYEAFKVALCHLRDRLEGSGISIVNVGYRRGYRLVIGE